MVADATAQYRHPYILQLAPVQGPERFGYQIKVGEGGTGPNERVAINYAKLEAGILGYHGIFH